MNWLIAVGVVLCGGLLLWAWYDGGEQTLGPMTAATTLPKVVQ